MLFAPREPEKRSRGAIAVSVAMHLVIGAALFRVVLGSNGIAEWLIGPNDGIQREKIQMVAVRPPRGGGNSGGAPVNAVVKLSVPRPGPGLAVPTSVPTSAPETAGGAGGSGGGTGNGFGTGSGAGASRGVVPGYDPRLYPGPAEPPRVVLTPKERLDSVIASRFAEYADSVNNAPHSNVTEDGRADLVYTRNGKRYGITQKGILLGNVKLPTALLALLPLNRVGGNPSALLRGEHPWQMRQQIQAGAQVALNAETFNERVKRIRERRDRERKDVRDGQTPPATTAPIQQQQAPLPDR